MKVAVRSSVGLCLACIGLILPAITNAKSAKIAARDGVYKKLEYVEEAGDLLGMAVEIRHAPQPAIIVTTCEGACHGGKSWPLKLTGQTITFTVCDDVVDQDGHAAKCIPLRYIGRFRPDGALVIFVPGVSGTEAVLRKVLHPKKDEVRNLACMDRC